MANPLRIRLCLCIIIAAAGLATLAAGCRDTDVRQIESLPAPRFNEPPTDWPPAAPPENRPLDEIEAGWRNHVLPARDWRWIVIHHSSTPAGNAFNFDGFHRNTRGWDELGYHFVIGNGTDSRDGQVEAGSRWQKQKHGAHCATLSRQFNEAGIGVCLVGDFQQPGSRPTERQWAALVKLCRFLAREHGITAERIIGHRHAQASEGEPTTDCPGRNFDLDSLRRAVAEAVP